MGLLQSMIFAAVLIWTTPVYRESSRHPPLFAIWNVGQGLWTTWITDDFCLHFDAGGEKAPWSKIRASCREKDNLFSFSHWDEDHISFARRASQLFPRSCLWHAPGGEGSPRKQHLMAALQPCSRSQISATEESVVHEITAAGPRPSLSRQKIAKSNDLSRIFAVDHSILAPGDATRVEEKNWTSDLRRDDIRLLVLGHHGSRTSTSEFLLKNLPDLQIAVASARKARYGHPHPEVIHRLQAARVALLSTEDWGSIFWEEGKKKRAFNRRVLKTNTK